jgi:hypothetical protein
MNKQLFFTEIRPMFGGKLSQLQVDGLNAILEANETYRVGNKQFAYILATVHHETDKTFQPIEEYGKGKGKLYGTNIKLDKKPYFDTKNIFFGRGHTQNTWYENYKKLTELAQKQGKDWDFFNNPNLLLQMQPSIWATFTAMQIGLYTGRKLSDYINTQKCDYINARRIINGTDKAELIAGYANEFYNILTKC